MTEQKIGQVVFDYTLGGNAEDLPEEKRLRVQKFWRNMERFKGLDFVVQTVAVATLLKNSKGTYTKRNG